MTLHLVSFPLSNPRRGYAWMFNGVQVSTFVIVLN